MARGDHFFTEAPRRQLPGAAFACREYRATHRKPIINGFAIELSKFFFFGDNELLKFFFKELSKYCIGSLARHH